MQQHPSHAATRDSLPILALPLTLAALAGGFFAVRVWHGYWFAGFVDESEHLLGGKMLNAGAVLYRDFVTQHGPLTFMLTQAYGAIFGWGHANGARLISAALAVAAAACVATTPALPDRIARLWAMSLFLGLTASVWLLQGLYLVNYHAIGGFLLVAALTLFVVPAWRGAQPDRARAAIAGACCTLAVATAYSFGPAIVLLSASALWAMALCPGDSAWRAFLAGAAAAALGVLVWLLMFGNVLGYLAFHFVENQFVQVHFMAFTVPNFLRSLVPRLLPWALVQTLALLCWAVSLALFLAGAIGKQAPRRLAGPILLGFAGILALDARGSASFQNGAFLLACIAMFAIALPATMIHNPAVQRPIWLAAGTLLMGLCITGTELAGRHATGNPVSFTRAQLVAGLPRTDLGVSAAPEFQRIRALVRPDERVLALPYAPGLYMAADRMPMDRYFTYLPWEAAYAKAPWFGEAHDLCADLPKAPPRLIYFDHWKVWNTYDMRDYMPCLFVFLQAHYRRQTDFPDLYVRVDQTGNGPIQP